MSGEGTAESYLLDTSVLIAYVRAGKVGQHIEAKYRLRSLPYRPLICVVSVGEIRALAARNNRGKGRLRELRALLDNLVWVDISLPEVLDAYVRVCTATPRGRTISDNDKWIAAAALATDSHLLTTDKDFRCLEATLRLDLIDQSAIPDNGSRDGG